MRLFRVGAEQNTTIELKSSGNGHRFPPRRDWLWRPVRIWRLAPEVKRFWNSRKWWVVRWLKDKATHSGLLSSGIPNDTSTDEYSSLLVSGHLTYTPRVRGCVTRQAPCGAAPPTETLSLKANLVLSAGLVPNPHVDRPMEVAA